MDSLPACRCAPLRGEAELPGDKSVSHRALIVAALCVGRSRIRGLSDGTDVADTRRALEQMGVASCFEPASDIESPSDVESASGAWLIDGVGAGGLMPPEDVINVGNSGTSARLLMGVLASQGLRAVMTGDSSLRARPMARVFTPLRLMGAKFEARPGGLLPVTIQGADHPVPVVYTVPVASAQVKSAILLAALNTPGDTQVIESQVTRDHTERLLNHLGAPITCVPHPQQGTAITLRGQEDLSGGDLDIPRDPSAAAFMAAAASLVPDSDIVLPNVGVNPLRMGFFDSLREMGGRVDITSRRVVCGEPWADIRVQSASLRGICVPPHRAASMIDEYPILACLAACAQGESRFEGVGELRVKESDRLGGLVRGLRACGVGTEADGDTLIIEGRGGPPPGGAVIASCLDHRMAMAFLILGMVTPQPVSVDDPEPVATSFPGFFASINRLGGSLSAAL